MLCVVITILCVSTPELDIMEGIQGIQGKVGPLIQRGDAGGQYKTMKFAINIFVIHVFHCNSGSTFLRCTTDQRMALLAPLT